VCKVMGLLNSALALIIWILREVKTVYYILVSPVHGKTHKERLESFYRIQAANYDNYRKRLLHGRETLFLKLSEIFNSKNNKDLVWIDMGAGTGYNCECMDSELTKTKTGGGGLKSRFKKVYLVDLSTSLLKQAADRIEEKDWTNLVEPVEADATQYVIPEVDEDEDEEHQLADLVTFSYSLTMIPDWFVAMEHALKILKPGGMLAIVDFFVGRKYPKEDEVQHSWFTRTFWRTFFAFDNVRLSDDHIPFLESRDVKVIFKSQRFGGVPYIPFIKAPYYILIVQKQ